MDLQLQLPPQQLLQLLLELITHAQQQQQASGGSSSNSSSSGTEAGGVAAAAGTLPFAVAELNHPQLVSVKALLGITPAVNSQARLNAAIQAGSSSSSSSSSSSNGLLSRAVADVLLRNSISHLPEADEIWAAVQPILQLPEQLPAGDLLQLLVELGADKHEQQQQDVEGRSKIAVGDETATAAAAAATTAAAGDAEGATGTAAVAEHPLCGFAALVKNCMHYLAIHVVLQFIQQAWESGSGAAAAAWQQAVPLQVLLLCDQLWQIEGVLARCIAKPSALLAISSSESTGDVNNHQQQQQQGMEAAASTAAAALKADLVQLVDKVASLLQMVRQFKEANAALNSTAAAGGGEGDAAVTNGITAAASSSSTSSSLAESGLDPLRFFASDGPLASGVLGFVAPSFAKTPSSNSSSSNPQQQQQQQQQQLHRQLWEAAMGSGLWDSSMALVDSTLQQLTRTKHFEECAAKSCALQGVQFLRELLGSNNKSMSPLQDTSLLQASQFAHDLQQVLEVKGVEVPDAAALAVLTTGHTVGGQIRMGQAALMSALGLTGRRCCRVAEQHKKQRTQQVLEEAKRMGLGKSSFVVMGMGDTDDKFCITDSSSSSSSSDEDAGAAAAAGGRSRRRSRDGIDMLAQLTRGSSSRRCRGNRGTAAAAAAAVDTPEAGNDFWSSSSSSSSSAEEDDKVGSDSELIPSQGRQQRGSSSSSSSSNSAAHHRRNAVWQRRLQRQQQGVISSDDDAAVTVSSDDDRYGCGDYWQVRRHQQQQEDTTPGRNKSRRQQQQVERSRRHSSSSSPDPDHIWTEVRLTEALLAESGDTSLPDQLMDRDFLGSSIRWTGRAAVAAAEAAAELRRKTQLSARERRAAIRRAQKSYRCGCSAGFNVAQGCCIPTYNVRRVCMCVVACASSVSCQLYSRLLADWFASDKK
jgi:hypothetical protein